LNPSTSQLPTLAEDLRMVENVGKVRRSGPSQWMTGVAQWMSPDTLKFATAIAFRTSAENGWTVDRRWKPSTT
jgi:hypothetical protein